MLVQRDNGRYLIAALFKKKKIERCLDVSFRADEGNKKIKKKEY